MVCGDLGGEGSGSCREIYRGISGRSEKAEGC